MKGKTVCKLQDVCLVSRDIDFNTDNVDFDLKDSIPQQGTRNRYSDPRIQSGC